MRTRDYGQFCGLARAAEVLGQRWTIPIVRDLLVGRLVHGDQDTAVPLDQSVQFARKLEAAGVRVDLNVVAGAGYAFLGVDSRP